MSAGQIGDQFSLTGPTISFHLRALVKSSLVVSERRRQFIVYRADFEQISELADEFMARCCARRTATGPPPVETGGFCPPPARRLEAS